MEHRKVRGIGPQREGRPPTSVRPAAATSLLLTLQGSVGNQALLRLLGGRTLQTKLAVNQPGDVYEQEADRVAQEVVSGSAPPVVQRKCDCGGAAGAGGECAECRKKRKESVQRRAEGAGPATAPPVVRDVLGSPGQPLDTATRAFFERRFGCTFRDVRVHTGEPAAEAANSVEALAFTVGRDVVFGAAQYAPRTQTGRELLAHELTHVVQQRAVPSGAVQRAERPNATSEAEVYRIADSVGSTGTATFQDLWISHHTPGSGTIQRQDAPTPLPKAEAMAQVRLRLLATQPSRAISQWKQLNKAERSFVVQVMAGRYGFDFARLFLDHANGTRKPDLSSTISNTDDTKALTARGFRYAGDPGGTPLWVHPSGREVTLLIGRRTSGGEAPPISAPPEPERPQAEVEHCNEICDDTDDEDSCNACCEERIPADDPKCRKTCEARCSTKL